MQKRRFLKVRDGTRPGDGRGVVVGGAGETVKYKTRGRER